MHETKTNYIRLGHVTGRTLGKPIIWVAEGLKNGFDSCKKPKKIFLELNNAGGYPFYPFSFIVHLSTCHSMSYGLRYFAKWNINLRNYTVQKGCRTHIWFLPGHSFIIRSGVRLSPLGTAAITGLLYQPQMTDDGDCVAIGGMKIGTGNRSTRRKPAPAHLACTMWQCEILLPLPYTPPWLGG
jgi:hypothetical protein